MKIDGRAIASSIFEQLRVRALALKERHIIPHLAIVLVGTDPASQSYVSQKVKKGEMVGAIVDVHTFPQHVSEKKVADLVRSLGANEGIDGIVVQRPLPSHIHAELLTTLTPPRKDIDAFRNDSLHKMPLALAVLKILKSVHEEIEETLPFKQWLKKKSIVIIGKGETGGGPVIALFKKMSIPSHVIDSKTKDRARFIKKADIIISAVGKDNVLENTDVKQGVILIGIGMHKDRDGKIHADYNEDITQHASFYTPIPGGVGPVNVAMLLVNLFNASQKRLPTLHSEKT